MHVFASEQVLHLAGQVTHPDPEEYVPAGQLGVTMHVVPWRVYPF